MLGLSDKVIFGGILLACLAVALFLFALHERGVGRDNYAAQVSSAQVKYSAQAKKVTTEVVTKYIHDTQVVHEKGETIIKKVPIYVTVKDDSTCTINNGFVSLWNAANTLSVSNPASGTNGSPSSIVLSDVAAQHVTEANICHGTETQLIALQNWVRLQEQVK
jgi:hypothetical protein